MKKNFTDRLAETLAARLGEYHWQAGDFSRERCHRLAKEITEAINAPAAPVGTGEQRRRAIAGSAAEAYFPTEHEREQAKPLIASAILAASPAGPGWLDWSGELEKRTVNLPSAMVAQCEELLFDLKRRGIKLSFSGFLELAVRDLLENKAIFEVDEPEFLSGDSVERLARDLDIGARRKPAVPSPIRLVDPPVPKRTS